MRRYPVIWSLLLCICCYGTYAQDAYLYIQGDKKLPFYIKVDGKMIPRYGKNYCIVPEMDSGIAHVEILFEQNKIPAESFDILIPGHGNRSFLLDSQQNGYALYDLKNKKYTFPNNK